jgi:3-sulfinopropanoyl-CoA desulfinase
VSRLWDCAAFPKRRSFSSSWKSPRICWCCRRAACAAGFADLINAYNSQRVGAGTVALGIAQGAFEKALAFVKEREQFGRPIAEFQGLQWMVADMAAALNAARLSLHQAALSADPFPDPLLAAQAKIIASETANTVTNQALQLFGARGYSRDYPMERMVREARMFAIAGGTAQALRTLVASRILDMKFRKRVTNISKRKELHPRCRRNDQ